MDYTRVNEFGQDGEAEMKAVGDKDKKDEGVKEEAKGEKDGGAVATGAEKKNATKRR